MRHMIKVEGKNEQEIEELDVARTEDITIGKMKRFEINGKEILIANVDGRYYALDNRCGHSNAALSSGMLNGNIVTCPLHAAEFDVTTGRMVKEPNLATPSMETFPEYLKKYTEYTYSLLRDIKVHDQEKFELLIDGDRIKIRLVTTSVE